MSMEGALTNTGAAPMTPRRIASSIAKRVYVGYIHAKVFFYRIKNRNRERVLVFSDSRGFDIVKRETRFNPFNGYAGLLIKKYNVHYSICPERPTTIIDFLKRHEGKCNNYDFIVLHAGIVDFSPRHRSVAKKLIYEQKPYDRIFGKDNMMTHLGGNLGVEYEGEQTINMFSLEMAEKFLIPRLAKMNNLIWIGCNNFVDGWEGNYFKPRPKNIKLVEEYSRLFARSLPNCVDLSDWDENAVMLYTCDNLHLTKAGHEELYRRIDNKIQQLQRTH
jgi:hypothetical protein